MSKDENIKNPITKYKKKMKKYLCCGCGWFWIGLAMLIVGIVLLVFYGKFWGQSGEWKRGLAYAGLAMLLVGFLVVGVGIAIFVTLCIVARRLDNSGRPVPAEGSDSYHKRTWEYGKAPYPQQPPPSTQPPTAPMMGSDSQDVHVDIAPHDKY